MTEEQAKKLKDDKKEKESPELNEELIDKELSELSGGDSLKQRHATDFPVKILYNGSNLGN